jgi:hypothetical protein
MWIGLFGDAPAPAKPRLKNTGANHYRVMNGDWR